MVETLGHLRGMDERSFVLRFVQPGLVGLIDGTLSTLAPIFAAAILSGSHAALFVGLATAVGAGISMGFSEALSDTGRETGRGSAIIRGLVTGAMTPLVGVFHSRPLARARAHGRPAAPVPRRRPPHRTARVTEAPGEAGRRSAGRAAAQPEAARARPRAAATRSSPRTSRHVSRESPPPPRQWRGSPR